MDFLFLPSDSLANIILTRSISGIAEALIEKGFEVERKNISIKDDLIKEVGSYSATIKLHKEVLVDIPFEIIAE